MKDAGTFKSERVLTSKQSSGISVKGSKKREILNFCSNNYLGLCDHPEIEKAAKDTIDKRGFGMSSVRFICGTQDIHKDLESELARFHGMDDAILFPSGFDANAGFFEAVLTDKDAIISDQLNHASIIDGIRLCKTPFKYRYGHMDMADLEAKLQEAEAAGARLKVIVTDGIFSMDGDVAPLKEIRALADKYKNTYIYVDECHCTGHIGPTGRGTPELFGVKVDFISTTLGKSLGGATGGYLAASNEVVTVLRNKARTYLFTNTVAPCVVGASRKALQLVDESKELMDKLRENTHYIRESFAQAGLNVLGHDDCPIVPVFLGDAKVAKAMSDNLLERGVLAIAFSFPVVPKDGARIRFQVSAGHTKEQLQRCVAAVVGAAKENGQLELFTTEAYDQRKESHERETANAVAAEAKKKDMMKRAAEAMKRR